MSRLRTASASLAGDVEARLVDHALRRLVELVDDSDVGHDALGLIIRLILDGRVVFDPPLAPSEQRSLRELIDKALICPRH